MKSEQLEQWQSMGGGFCYTAVNTAVALQKLDSPSDAIRVLVGLIADESATLWSLRAVGRHIRIWGGGNRAVKVAQRSTGEWLAEYFVNNEPAIQKVCTTEAEAVWIGRAWVALSMLSAAFARGIH